MAWTSHSIIVSGRYISYMMPGFMRQEEEALILRLCYIYFILLVKTVTELPTFRWLEKQILPLDGDGDKAMWEKIM